MGISDFFGWGLGQAPNNMAAMNNARQYATTTGNYGSCTSNTLSNYTISAYDGVTHKLSVSNEFAQAIADKMDEMGIRKKGKGVVVVPKPRSIAPKPLPAKSHDFVQEMRMDAQEWLKPVLAEMRG